MRYRVTLIIYALFVGLIVTECIFCSCVESTTASAAIFRAGSKLENRNIETFIGIWDCRLPQSRVGWSSHGRYGYTNPHEGVGSRVDRKALFGGPSLYRCEHAHLCPQELLALQWLISLTAHIADIISHFQDANQSFIYAEAALNAVNS